MFLTILLHFLAPGLPLWQSKKRLLSFLLAASFFVSLLLFSWLQIIFSSVGYICLVFLWGVIWFSGLWVSLSVRDKRKISSLSIFVFIPMFWLTAFVVFFQSSVLMGWQLFYIPSSSMEPTLKPGNVVLTDTRNDQFGSLGRNDIIVFTAPRDKKTMIKRIVAMGGDSVRITNESLFINDLQILDKAKAADRDIRTLQPAQFFMLGDNVNKSIDSRYWGPISASSIKAIYRYKII